MYFPGKPELLFPPSPWEEIRALTLLCYTVHAGPCRQPYGCQQWQWQRQRRRQGTAEATRGRVCGLPRAHARHGPHAQHFCGGWRSCAITCGACLPSPPFERSSLYHNTSQKQSHCTISASVMRTCSDACTKCKLRQLQCSSPRSLVSHAWASDLRTFCTGGGPGSAKDSGGARSIGAAA